VLSRPALPAATTLRVGFQLKAPDPPQEEVTTPATGVTGFRLCPPTVIDLS